MNLSRQSLASYDEVKRSLAAREAEVLDVLHEAPLGLTGFEIAQSLNRHPYTVRPRLTGLKDHRLIIDTGQVRRNPHGKNETVWRYWPHDPHQAVFAF